MLYKKFWDEIDTHINKKIRADVEFTFSFDF